MKRILIALALVGGPAFSSTYPYLPDPVKTPGVVASTDKALVCTKNYTGSVRNVSNTTKKRVYNSYGVDKNLCTKGCKIDHLIPLAIGGANDQANLWPHEYGAEWNVYAKTRLEVRLRKEVCSDRMPIEEAQTCIKSDWTRCFKKFYP